MAEVSSTLQNSNILSLEEFKLIDKLKMLENDAKFLDALFNGFLITLLKNIQDKITLTNEKTGEIYELIKVRNEQL